MNLKIINKIIIDIKLYKYNLHNKYIKFNNKFHKNLFYKKITNDLSI